MPPGRKDRGERDKKPKKIIKIRKLKEVVFDEDARKEYLTGFSKRKKARELAVRSKAIDRDREEKNESRRDIRNERKEQAALNVRNANALYGDANDPLDGSKPSFDSDEDASSDDDEPSAPAGPSVAYETSDLITTVHIEPFSLSRSSSPAARPPPPGGYENAGGGSDDEKEKKDSMKSTRASGVEVAKKRVRNKPQARTKMTREDKKERAKGGKAKKAGFLKGNTGTKGKSNKGER